MRTAGSAGPLRQGRIPLPETRGSSKRGAIDGGDVDLALPAAGASLASVVRRMHPARKIGHAVARSALVLGRMRRCGEMTPECLERVLTGMNNLADSPDTIELTLGIPPMTGCAPQRNDQPVVLIQPKRRNRDPQYVSSFPYGICRVFCRCRHGSFASREMRSVVTTLATTFKSLMALPSAKPQPEKIFEPLPPGQRVGRYIQRTALRYGLV